MEYRDYYALLGVPRTADAEEIKRAYRRKARKFHPDVSKEKNAEARFKEVQEAYEVLKDTEKRTAYDQLGANWRDGQQFRAPPGFDFGGRGGPQGGAHASGGFSDFFSSLFGSSGGGGGGFGGGEDLGELFGRRAGQARQARARGRDVRVSLTLPLEEAHAGGPREIDFDRRRVDGTAERRNLRVKIPAGVLPGQVSRLGSQGDEGVGGPAGDLLLEVQHQSHRHYKLEGRDLHLPIPLAPWEAALGVTVQVPTLEGAVDLRIPPGSTAGRKLRLRGRGFAGERGAPEGRGDLYVVVQIAMPPASENPAVGAAWEALRDAVAFNPREGWT
jgi:curved DNA-binding protein